MVEYWNIDRYDLFIHVNGKPTLQKDTSQFEHVQVVKYINLMLHTNYNIHNCYHTVFVLLL